jgi:hypothetical protein
LSQLYPARQAHVASRRGLLSAASSRRPQEGILEASRRLVTGRCGKSAQQAEPPNETHNQRSQLFKFSCTKSPCHKSDPNAMAWGLPFLLLHHAPVREIAGLRRAFVFFFFEKVSFRSRRAELRAQTAASPVDTWNGNLACDGRPFISRAVNQSDATRNGASSRDSSSRPGRSDMSLRQWIIRNSPCRQSIQQRSK